MILRISSQSNAKVLGHWLESKGNYHPHCSRKDATMHIPMGGFIFLTLLCAGLATYYFKGDQRYSSGVSKYRRILSTLLLCGAAFCLGMLIYSNYYM